MTVFIRHLRLKMVALLAAPTNKEKQQIIQEMQSFNASKMYQNVVSKYDKKIQPTNIIAPDSPLRRFSSQSNGEWEMKIAHLRVCLESLNTLNDDESSESNENSMANGMTINDQQIMVPCLNKSKSIKFDFHEIFNV